MPKVKQELITNLLPVKKKRDRFNGKTEEEVLEMKLPDHLVHGLDIVIVGINPGLTAAYIGHHYAGPGNHFWKCLHLSGLIPEPMNAYDDARLKEYGIGFTNIVARTSRSSSDLTRKEIKEGAEILQEKITTYQPKIAVFNGKGIYEIFCGRKNFFIGKQPEPFPGTNTAIFVMPSSSARCSQLPRAVDKIPFYAALKKLRDYLRGNLAYVNESELIFPDLELKVEPKKEKPDPEASPVSATASMTKKGRKRKVKGADAQIENNASFPLLSLPAAVKEDGRAGPSAHWMYTPGIPFYPGVPLIKQEPDFDSIEFGMAPNCSNVQLPNQGYPGLNGFPMLPTIAAHGSYLFPHLGQSNLNNIPPGDYSD